MTDAPDDTDFLAHDFISLFEAGDVEIVEFLGFPADPETDHTLTDMSQIIGVAMYRVRYPDATEEELFTGLRPGENDGWNEVVVVAAQAWRDAGGVIPAWDPNAPDVLDGQARSIAAEAENRLVIGIQITGTLGNNVFDADMFKADDETKTRLLELVDQFGQQAIPAEGFIFMTDAKKPLTFKAVADARDLLNLVSDYRQRVLDTSAREQQKVLAGDTYDPGNWPDNVKLV